MSTDIIFGKLIEEEGKRDAVHVAVAPVVAGFRLSPGEHVGFVNDGDAETVGVSKNPIGIIDPFLKSDVKKGQRCYLFLYQNTVTSLRHEWTHPAFETQEAKKTLAAIGNLGNVESVAWLTSLASKVKMNYGDLIQAGKDWLDNDEYQTLGFDTPDEIYTHRREFWKHFQIVTGIEIPDDKKEDTFFSCAC